MEERLRYLFKKYSENTCSAKELEEFFNYIRRSENDDLLRQEIRQLYDALQPGSLKGTHVDETGKLVMTEPELQQPETAPKTGRRRTVVFAMAAMLFIAVIITWTIERQQTAGPKPQLASLTTKTTNRSESKFLVLEDGTEVWINAASSLEFPDEFDKTKREVFLRGEAYFDVKHADKLPFIIHTGKISTTVLGTAFNIKAYPGQKEVVVSVSRGKVKVTRNDGWATTLEVGQQVRVRESGNTIQEKKVAPADVAAWQQGTIVYDDETFEDIIADLQRTYNVTILVKDPLLAAQRISTSFKREIGVEQALQVLCKLTDTEYKKSAGNYLIQ